jgi:diguanylate cyclase (GGDEF)-like protein
MPDIYKPVDRADITKRVDRAEKLLQKGKTAEALEEYMQVLAADPANDTITQMAADLSLSLQRIPQAVKLLGGMFERQVLAGDATRASLTYKKLARFVDPTWEQKIRFGGLLENSNRKLAIETYENALQELTKQGRKQDSLTVLQKILRLDAGEKNLLRFAELSSEVGDGKAAAAAFLKLAEQTKTSGGNPAPWVERAYREDPSDPQIALAYGKAMLDQGQANAAIFAIEAHVIAGSASDEMRQTYAQALLAAHRLSDAETIIWQLFEANPSRSHDIARLIEGYLDAGQEQAAVALARKFQAHQQRKGDRRSFLTTMQEIIATRPPSADMLEFMCEQFNSANRESDYCQTLLRLFDLHSSTGNYEKAAECLDRAAEVDAYERGHHKRLQMLQGKIDERRYNAIASRFSGANATSAPVRSGENLLGDAALQDLMLQAEILVQYGMRSKAVERLQRIMQLFPHEEERNHALQQLYSNAGLVPKYTSAEPAVAKIAPKAATLATPASPPPVAASPAIPASQATDDLSSFTRVAEITRKIYRQNNADSILSTSVSEIGAQWKTSRCVVAMRKPGLRPTSNKEYCGQDVAPTASEVLERFSAAVHDLTLQRGGTLAFDNAQIAPELQDLRDLMAGLDVASLLAVALVDGVEPVGILILTQAAPKAWNPNELLVLKTICDQIVIALNNAGLRRLVKSLSVTDERSGLLKRASYLDLLLAETRRNVQQGTPMSVLLMQLGEKTSLLKELGENGVEALIHQIGQLFSTNIRQNDLAFRYDTTIIAIVLAETGEKDGLLAAEKLQRLMGHAKLAERKDAIRFNAGLAEAVIRAEYDPVDIVTEVINRAEQALQDAAAQGMNKMVALASALANAAVA